jgi:hypothetical protein
MELDFSDQINSRKRRGPKSSAQTPAKPDEKKKGSDKNKPGSAGKDGPSITFSEKVLTALKNKVQEHNEKYPSKKVTLSQLKKVYRRGSGAFSSSHRPGKTRGQWAMARVNTFLRMRSGKKVKKSYRAADQDIARGSFYEDIPCTVEDFIAANIIIDQYDLEGNPDPEIFPEVEEGYEEYVDEAIFAADEKKGKKLNKPFRTSGGPKKFSVYVKNDKGNVVKVNFGDPNMEIKRDDPKRRKNFRARHNCDDPGPKWKARYWSCKMWSQKSVTNMTKGEEEESMDESDADGLWENIRKKKQRMGDNYKPAKPGDKDRPQKKAWDKAKGEE